MLAVAVALLALVAGLAAADKEVAVGGGAATGGSPPTEKELELARHRAMEEKEIVTKKNVASVSGMASPGLTPGLDCSACEVTAREIFYGSSQRSKNDKFAGTEVELIEILEDACVRLNKYSLAQESFGAHVKVFADYKVKFDVQNVERVEFYSKKEEDRYQGAIWRLVKRCEEYVGKFEDELTELVRQKAEEADIRKFMCLEKTDVCKDEHLKPYKDLEARRRRKWKRKMGRKRLQDKLASEVNDPETFRKAKKDLPGGGEL